MTEAGNCYILATKKKCDYLQPAVDNVPAGNSIVGLTLIECQKGGGKNNIEQLEELERHAKIDESNGKKVAVGIILKESILNDKKTKDSNKNGKKSLVTAWEERMQDKVELKDVTVGLSIVMSVKEEMELDLLKKASILANKVLKRGVITRIENVIDTELSVTHEQLAGELDGMIEDPSKVNLSSVDKDLVQSCYFPIVQSGGSYDIKISAQSNNSTMKYDIILVSFGTRYSDYCSNIARTFLVDPPKKVAETYEILLATHEACLKVMRPGKPLKSVHHEAQKYLTKSGNKHLIKCLPKNLGFSMGLDFRDSNFLLTAKNQAVFKTGMVFTLSIGLIGVDLEQGDKKATNSKSHVKNLDKFALLVSDTVGIQADGSVELFTKHDKSLDQISYQVNDSDSDDSDDKEESDAVYARKVSRQEDNFDTGNRRSGRLASNSGPELSAGAAERQKKQLKIMERNNEKRLRELQRLGNKKNGKNDGGAEAEEIVAYNKTTQYPDFVLPNQVKVDMAKECVILPICGNPIPFHISTIKNVVLPDPDTATYLRINFYSSGVALGKDAPANTVKLIQKYAPYATFIRELTFRSLESQNLTQAYRQISELRKRIRQRELREQEEANLVEQEKLVRTRTERVPRLSDLSMRPVFFGKKTTGNLEAHTNGLRFLSTRHEQLEIMYKNIEHAVFQPCENEIMVLIHFHLKNPIMVGKKRQKDIQYFTEVIDASLVVDAGRRSMYDPDEIDDEQRERHLRKKLNTAFKEFCLRVEKTSRKYGYGVEFETPYRDLGFMGTPSREMVFVQPTMNCLVNLTETPFFLVNMSLVDHVHFERVSYMSNSIDMVLIPKDHAKPVWRVDMIPTSDKDHVQDWLTDMEYSYTEGPMNLNWKQIMQTVQADDRFYMDTHDDEVTPKDAGWEFLSMHAKEDEEEEDTDGDDSVFSDGGSEQGSSDEEDDEEDASEEFDSESSEGSYDGDEDLDEQGMDWDEMEREAAADDRRKSREPKDSSASKPKKPPAKRRRR